MWKLSLFWPVWFLRYDSANIEFHTVVLARSGTSSMQNFLSTNPKMVTAVMRYFDVLGRDKSIASALWWGIFSSQSDCRTWKFYASMLPYNGSTVRVNLVKTWRQTATDKLSKKKPGARSRKFRSKSLLEVVLAAILVSESTKCCESAQRRWQNVGIAVPRERAWTKVQFGVLFPDRK